MVYNKYEIITKKRKNPKKKKKHKHSRDDSLTPEEFDHLFEVAEHSDNALLSKFEISVMGIGGFRRGELLHFKRSWVDFKKKEIHIPKYDPCACRYCINQWKKKFKKTKAVFSIENVKKSQWVPKTEAGARTIPFDFNPILENIIVEFFDKFERLPYDNVSTIYNHTRKLGELAGIQNLHPHALRSTAVTQLANDGMSQNHLMKFIGHEDEKIIRVYINRAGINLPNEFERIYGKKINLPIDASYRVFCLTTIGKKLILRKHRSDEEKWLRGLLFNGQEAQRKLDVRWGQSEY